MTESWAKLWGFKIIFIGQRRERRWRRSCQKDREKTRNVIEIKRWGGKINHLTEVLYHLIWETKINEDEKWKSKNRSLSLMAIYYILQKIKFFIEISHRKINLDKILANQI